MTYGNHDDWSETLRRHFENPPKLDDVPIPPNPDYPPPTQKRKPPTTRKILIGHISVDAGLCIVGDPCYLRTFDPAGADDPSPRPLDGAWNDFLARIPAVLEEGAPAAAIGHAAVTTTGHGDGIYPVYIETDISAPGIVRRLIVDFEVER